MRDDTSALSTRRIMGDLIAALSTLTCVRRIDSFGSVATGGADQWSDLDLFVSCEAPERTAWLAAAAIRSSKPVAFYRTFASVPQPSGRYWFDGESPFNRLDVSFCSPAEHEAVCRSGVNGGHPVTLHPEYVARLPADPSADEGLRPPAGRVDVSPRETAIGRLLYIHLEAAKKQLRGQPTKRSVRETRAALLEAVFAAPTTDRDSGVVRFISTVDAFIQTISP